jgi:hypothetical protein
MQRGLEAAVDLISSTATKISARDYTFERSRSAQVRKRVFLRHFILQIK